MAAMLGDKQAFKMAASRDVLDVNIQYSDYFAGLKGYQNPRYHVRWEKSTFSKNIELLPNVQNPDILNYLVFQTSWATKTQMKAYKLMDAYKFIVCGWVKTHCTG